MTLGALGPVNIGTAEQAAKALEPLAGSFAKVLFSVGIIGVATVAIGVNPIRASYLAAIFNGVTAPPLIVLIVILARSQGVLGKFRSGWASLVATSIAGVAMTAFPLIALLKS